MEVEVRFYYPISEYNNKVSCLEKIKYLKNDGRKYEKTSQFNHPNLEYDFYSKEIDGRFRVRLTESDNIRKCKLSWKRRLPNTTETNVNKEEEVVSKYVKLLKLDFNDSYRLSWDDKYAELCKEQNKEIYSHVLFGKDMPEVKFKK